MVLFAKPQARIKEKGEGGKPSLLLYLHTLERVVIQEPFEIFRLSRVVEVEQKRVECLHVLIGDREDPRALG